MNQLRAQELHKHRDMIHAYSIGKTLQIKNSDGQWCTNPDPKFWDVLEYRIKPEPRTIWVNEYENGMVAVHTSSNEAERRRINCNQKGKTVQYKEIICAD